MVKLIGDILNQQNEVYDNSTYCNYKIESVVPWSKSSCDTNIFQTTGMTIYGDEIQNSSTSGSGSGSTNGSIGSLSITGEIKTKCNDIASAPVNLGYTTGYNLGYGTCQSECRDNKPLTSKLNKNKINNYDDNLLANFLNNANNCPRITKDFVNNSLYKPAYRLGYVKGYSDCSKICKNIQCKNPNNH